MDENLRENLTKDMLNELYWEKNWSLERIAQKYGIHERSVRRYMDRYKIPRRSNTASHLLPIREKFIKSKHELEIKRLTFDDLPETEYEPINRSNLNITIPLSTVKKEKLPATVTIVLSDLHLGDSDFLPETYHSCVGRVKIVLQTLYSMYDIKTLNVVGNGDIVSGREVYELQALRNLLSRGHWQVFLAEIILKDTLAEWSEVKKVDNVFLGKGTHESLGENYLLYLKRTLLNNGNKTFYISKEKVLNIASPIGNYNVLFTHGYGSNAYFPVSNAIMRDLWKMFNGYKMRNIPVERVCLGHTHWLTSNLTLEGMTVDVTGGFQRWEYSLSQRPCGMIVYLYSNGELSSIPVKPDGTVESKEKSESALEYKNLRFYGEMLQKHYTTIEEKENEIEKV